MKDLRKAVTILGVLAGGSSLMAFTMIGCSGDTTNGDAGPDATNETGPDAPLDVNTNDVSDGGVGDSAMDSSDANPIAVFQQQEAVAFCARFQSCCNSADAGPFDYARCINTAGGGWNGSNDELTAEVLARGNVMLNSTAATGCLAGLATLSCPAIPSNEITTVTPNCYQAVSGTLGVGADCLASIECQKTEYCKFAGVDAGKTDAGSVLGQCATLVAQNGLCGQAPPYGNPNYTSEECAYKNWNPPSLFCDYDSFPDAGGYTCQPLRANGAGCFSDPECASGICGTLTQDCSSDSCTCLTTRDFTPFCVAEQIKDAGSD